MHLGLGIQSKLITNLKRAYIYVKNGFCFKTILFYPENVYNVSMMKIIIKENCYKVTNDPNAKFDIAISWDYDTFRLRHRILEDVHKNTSVINLDCLDISKTYIGEIFHQVFGYSILVDPTTYTGPVVKKSELNALHNGVVVNCPIKYKEKDFNYTKLIDGTVNENYTLDLRVLYINGNIPFIYERYKGLDNRFDAKDIDSKHKKYIEVSSVNKVFTKDEINKIITFCKEVKLDYGELDVLRDNIDKKIYIVDVNPTPSHQPYEFKKSQKSFAYKTAAKLFDKEFF